MPVESVRRAARASPRALVFGRSISLVSVTMNVAWVKSTMKVAGVCLEACSTCAGLKSLKRMPDVAHGEGLSRFSLSRSLFNAFLIALEYSAQDVNDFTVVWFLLWETLEGELFATRCITRAVESRCKVT